MGLYHKLNVHVRSNFYEQKYFQVLRVRVKIDGEIAENSQIPNMHFYYVDNGNLNAIPPPFLEPLHIVHSGQ